MQAARYLDDSHALGNRTAALRAMRAAAAPATASVPLRGHGGLAFVAGFTADATRVVTFDLAGTVRVLDPSTGAPTATLDGDGDVRVAVAPVGTLAVASWPDGGTVFDTTDGEVVATLAPLADPLLVAMSPDGARVAVAGLGGEVQVADARTGETRWTVATGARTPTALAFAATAG